jgi:parvulin-like peptidyl-prolyl isomerase
MLEGSKTCPGCGAAVTQGESTEGDAPKIKAFEGASASESAEDVSTSAASAEGVAANADASDESDAVKSEASGGSAKTTDAGAPVTPPTPARPPGATTPAKGASAGMSAATKAAILIAVGVVAAVGLLFWQFKFSGFHVPTNVKAEDMSLLVESFPPQERLKLANSADDRKKLADELKKILAVAREAEKQGYADKPEVQRQFEAMRVFVTAQMYLKKQHEANAKPEDLKPKQEDVDAFLKDPTKTKQADSYLEDMQKLGMVPEGQPITDDIREQFRNQWAQMSLLAQKGKAAGVDKDHAVQLQIQMQQAVALSRIYEAQLAKQLEPTEQEIQQYFAEHPESDPKVARQKAEDILKRVKAGEDFATLAKENSDDAGSKEQGGDLGWFGRGQMVKEFEDEAFKLKDNEVSGIVETKFGFHIIQVTGHRMGKAKLPDAFPGSSENSNADEKGGQMEEQIQARHILIKPNVPNQNPFAPPKSPRDTAKDEILSKKLDEKIDELVKKSDVKVPDDFPVKKPDLPPAALSPHGGMGEAPPEMNEEELPPPSDEGNANAGKSPAGSKPKTAPPAGKKK